MEIIADLHLHSKYSRAVSQQMMIPQIAKWAKRKGINLLATSDWTHPLWLRELKENLEETGEGIYSYKGEPKDVFFLLSTEISSIYTQNGRPHRIHNLVFAPSFSVVEEINNQLRLRGANLLSDGRPITGLSSIEICELVFSVSPDCLVIPAHVYTPWYSLYGSRSGFDSIKECFGKFADQIYAIETGLSSSPDMNWRIKELDNRSITSFSDAHCVHPDSLIYLARGGIAKIKSLDEDKKLWSLDFKNGLKLKSSLIAKIHKLPAPNYLYQIKTRSWELLATPNHRFFVLENERIKEKQAFQLKINDLIACVRKTKIGNKRAVYLGRPKFRQRTEISQNGLKFLKKKRLIQGFSAKEISFKLGKSKDYIWMIETERIRSLKMDVFEKLCKLYKVKSKEFCKKFKVDIFPKIKTPQYTTKEFCQFLGYALGDGGMERRGGRKLGFSLTDKDKNLLLFYQKLAFDLFGIKGRLKKSNTQNSFRLHFPLNLLLLLEKAAGGIFAYSNKREIPQIVFKLPKYQLAAFLRGFYDAEGTFDHHGLSLCSSNKALLKQVQYLLLKFGLPSFIYPDFERNKKKYRYKLIIYGQEQLRIFRKKIGFEASKKRGKLWDYLSKLKQKPKDSFKDPLPLGKIIDQCMKELNIEVKELPKNLQNFYYKNFKGLKRRNIKEFIKFFEKTSQGIKEVRSYQKLRLFFEADICWELVKSLRKATSNCKFVYDLTIPNYENYVVNGIITHNSPAKLGREATAFEVEDIEKLRYEDIKKAIQKQKIAYTIEFHPEEGKYHYTGHRNCGVKQSPEETKKLGAICPVCGRRLTVGVMHRVEELANRTPDFKPKKRPPYKMLVPLMEILAEALEAGVSTQIVETEYNRLTGQFESEFKVLLDVEISKIAEVSGEKVAEGIKRVREGEIVVDPGYDGVFGTVKIWGEKEEKKQRQMSLF